MPIVQIFQKSIVDLDTDCIVNPSNTKLQGIGSTSGEIFKKAGSSKLQNACDKIGVCEVGEAVVTSGFELKQKFIIHTVGPKWIDGYHKEAFLLDSSYRRCLDQAEKNGCTSIGFPLISAGNHGYPVDQAWEVALKAISMYYKMHPKSVVNEVVFAVINQETFEIGKKLITKCFPESTRLLTGLNYEEFLIMLQRILSMTEENDPVSVQMAKITLTGLLSLEKVSEKPEKETVRLLMAAIEKYEKLVNHKNEFCSFEYEDSLVSKNKRRRLRLALYPHC